MKSNKVITKILSNGNVKVIHGNCSNIDPYIEWIKWLSYIPEYEQKRINELKQKNNNSLEELNELLKYENQNKMLELFKKYGTDNINKEEYMKVYNFMLKQSINDFMLSKLSIEELEYAKEKIKYLEKLPFEELRNKVLTEQDRDIYNNLSMVDAYILHIISKINFDRSMKKLNKEIDTQIKKMI